MPFSVTLLDVTLPFGFRFKVGSATVKTKRSPTVGSTSRKPAVRVRTRRTASRAPRATVISGPEIAPAPTAAPLHVPDAACFVTVTAKPAEPQSFIARTMIEGISLAGYFTPQAGQPVIGMGIECVAAVSAAAGAATRYGPGMLAALALTPLAAARRTFLGF